MIKLSNGRTFKYVYASGSLGFDTMGWWWEWLFVWFGLIKRELFFIVLKSLSLPPIKGNYRWYWPFGCVKLIRGGAVNKVGLTNPGFWKWKRGTAPKIDFKRYDVAVSITGNEAQCVEMAQNLNDLPIAAIEINESCPNTLHSKENAQATISKCKAVKAVSVHPLILKIGADQEGEVLARELLGVVEAIAFNTLDFEKVFPGKRTPLHRLQKKVKGTGGGVSGRELQKHNWPFMERIHKAVPQMPLIASSMMEYEDLGRVDAMGASAYSFGTINLPTSYLEFWTLFTNPLKATRIVLRHMAVRTRAVLMKDRCLKS